MHRHAIHLVSAVSLCLPCAGQVVMTHLAGFDVSTLGIGTTASSVAWNGTDLVVGGYNNGSLLAAVALARCSNALTNPVWSAPFGVEPGTNPQRGFINLAFDGAGVRLAVGYDNGAAPVAPDGLQLWIGGTQSWVRAGRGSSGVGFDPGWPGGTALGRGVAWARFGTTGRALQDALLGADLWTFASGMNLNVPGLGTFFRDLDFDDANGDIYLRASNNVVVGQRTGDNDCTMLLFADANDADTVALQNVAVVRTPTGAVVLWNDRFQTAMGQSWFDVVKATRLDGTPDRIDWGTFQPPTGTGAYDFSFHAGTGTLAISDFANRRVHLFAVSVPPHHRYGSGCAGVGGVVPVLDGSSALQPGTGGAFTWALAGFAPNSLALVALGTDRLDLPLGGGCTLRVDPLLVALGPYVSGAGAAGSGFGSAPLTFPGGFAGFGVTAQGIVLENFALASLVFSNGLQLVLP
ncbi:MAG: hypothetical protein ACK5UQ_18295 [Planctomycetota bacterium]|jgi:hypothetical protein